jgi:hypothetical protein
MADKLVRTVNVDVFVVDDKLTVTREGVELSQAKTDQAVKSAEENGIRLLVEPVSKKTETEGS